MFNGYGDFDGSGIGGGFVVYLDHTLDLYGFEPSTKFAWCLNIYDR